MGVRQMHSVHRCTAAEGWAGGNLASEEATVSLFASGGIGRLVCKGG